MCRFALLAIAWASASEDACAMEKDTESEVCLLQLRGGEHKGTKDTLFEDKKTEACSELCMKLQDFDTAREATATAVEAASLDIPTSTSGVAPGRQLVVIFTGTAIYKNLTNEVLSQMAQLGIDNWVVFCEDDDCETDPKHTVNARRGLSECEGTFATQCFMQLNALRPMRINHFLERGVDVLYVDSDVLWNRNIVPELYQNIHGSIAFASDNCGLQPDARQWIESDSVCSGLVFAKASEFGKHVMKVWYEQLFSSWTEEHKHHDDQYGGLQPALKQLNAECAGSCGDQVELVGHAQILPGCLADQASSEQMRSTGILHANFRFGIAAKTRTLERWKEQIQAFL